MLLRAHKSGFFIILVFCFLENISSSPQRQIKQNAASSTTNQTTGSTTRMASTTRLTESYLPATMQALAYYIELLQYEPVHTTTVEPPFTVSTTPLTLPSGPSVINTPQPPIQQPVTWWSPPSTTQRPTGTWQQPTSPPWSPSTQKPPHITWTTSPWTTTKKPVTWWSPPSTTTTNRPVTWWSPPSTTTTKKPVWWSPTQAYADSTNVEPVSTSTARPTTTRRPLVSTTTPSWWHQETTPFHGPGNFAPDRPNANLVANAPQHHSKPSSKPPVGDLSVLSIANLPYFEYFVPTNTKTFAKKPEYELLDQYPAELLQDIEKESYESPKGTDQELANEFRRVYDDFFTRTRIFAPITGKKRIPPTRPYVLFLILYDLCKREAKRLNLQEFTGYSNEMLDRLHETSKYSAERQLYTLMNELLLQNSIFAADVKMRINEIMIDLANPNSVTAKALHILPTLKFEM